MFFIPTRPYHYAQPLTAFMCLLWVGTLCCPLALSQSPSVDEQLTQLEQRFLGASQPGLTIPQRLDLLETTVFGQADTQTINPTSRLDKINALYQQSLPVAPLPQLGQEASPENHPAQPPDATTLPSAESYPLITALEQKLLHRTFEGHPLAIRLDRLEYKLYKSTFKHQSLSERMDQLVRRFPDVLNAAQAQSPASATATQPVIPNQTWSQQSKLYQTLGRLEMTTFQQTYPNLSISQRVTHLEQSHLGISYPNDTLDVRLKRLLFQRSE